MKHKENIEWFKQNIAPLLDNYSLIYDSYKDGDFGDLERVSIESNTKCGGVDFWEKEYWDIDVFDLKRNEQILNIFLEPGQDAEKENVWKRLLKALDI